MKVLSFIFSILFGLSSEAMIRIALVDTGVNVLDVGVMRNLCKSGHYDTVTKSELIGNDAHQHGNDVARVIINNVSGVKYCLVVIRIDLTTSSTEGLLDALKKTKFDYLNISLTYPKYSVKLEKELNKLSRKGVKIYIAAGNKGINLGEVCDEYPGCLRLDPNINVVGALVVKGKRTYYSNYGGPVNRWESGDFELSRGTSYASPRALARDLMEEHYD